MKNKENEFQEIADSIHLNDTNEGSEIIKKANMINDKEHSPLCNDDFFYADLRAIAEDGAKEE
ncbi:hypothetical protein KUV80_16175 [Fictibacillus nanhaiensis]|uniref:hypothetical protein n=1 Tax=Fictibacillus nanhaiensis TaxID=742169 RepID=UPI001C93A9B4|nr:hypothetical protein [Fictibacillus nanhaiensis]MBY6038198.1 hypothetical protein [Fictibacillus nanhaiensis]